MKHEWDAKIYERRIWLNKKSAARTDFYLVFLETSKVLKIFEVWNEKYGISK